MSTWKYCTPKIESGWQIEHFRTRRADGSIAAPPCPAPPSQLATDQQFCSSVSSPIRAQPFCTFLFQASFYLFLLAGSCESCQMKLTGWPLANSASRYSPLQFGRWTLMLSSRILAQISRWRCHYKYIMQSTFLCSGSRSTPYWFQ